MIDRAFAALRAAGASWRLGPCVLLALVLAFAAPGLGLPGAQAQTAPGGAPPPISAGELQRLVDTLQNEHDRAHLVRELQGLIAAERGLAPPRPKSPATLVEDLSQRLDTLSEEVLAAAAVVVDAPRLLGWLEDQAGDPGARAFWLEVGTRLGVIFGSALFFEWALRRLLARPRRTLGAGGSDQLLLRLALMLARAILDALPILVFAGVAYLALVTIGARFATTKVATTLISAYVTARMIAAIARIVLLPRQGTSLLPLSGETRGYLFIWIKRFAYWTVYGYAVPAGTWWLGVPGSIYSLLLKAVALVLAILAVIFVLQNRTVVGRWLRGREPAATGSGGDHGSWRVLRARLADTWHVLAIVYVLGIYLVYALRVEGGFVFVARGTIVTLAALLLARLAVGLMRRASRRGFAIGADLKARFPTLEQRANRYLPVLSAVAAALVYAFALLAVLQAWSIESFAWFGSDLGRRMTGGFVTIGVVLLAALVAWELFTSAIERYLNAIDGDGMPIARSARARTLLPLLRTAMLVLLLVLVVLIVLSELGVNIAPLLAGAGVVGLAIGFGSQALVKDVITGLFILIEDSLAVGDVVDVGQGHAGVVEAISIRTIRLRDLGGTVHSIPFSSVTWVSNLTKDYAYAVSNVTISYREDVDQVAAILREIGAALLADPRFRPLILEPLEFIGIDKMTENGIVLQSRIKTLPRQQWAVGREFSRLLKIAFDRNGIEMPYALKPGYLGEVEERLRRAAAAEAEARGARPAMKTA